MKLTGEPDAIATLRALHAKNAGFMKALLDDCRSATDHTTSFRDEEGHRFRLVLDSVTGELTVTSAPPHSMRPSRP